MSRTATIALAAVAATLALCPPASAALGWHDAQAGVPASVTLEAVARHGEAVVAVGRDGADGRPVVYRLAGGTWSREVLPGDQAGDPDPDGAPLQGGLHDVAVTAAAAWAVGERADGTPLLLQLPGGGAALAAGTGTWAVVAAPTVEAPAPAMGALRSVALHDAAGYAGDATGALWPISDAGASAQAFRTLQAGAVNGLALTGATAGFAVTQATAAESRIFAIEPPSVEGGSPMVKPAVASPETSGLDVRAVALRTTADSTAGIAVDESSYWQFQGSNWSRVSPGASTSCGTGFGAGARPADVAMAIGVDAIAGSRDGAGGTVWRRSSSSSPWQCAQVATAALNGIAAGGPEDIWVVGDQGAVMHYYRAPDENTGGGGGGNEGGGSGGETGGGETGGTSSTNGEGGGSTTTTVPPAQSGDPVVYVVETGQPTPKQQPSQQPKPRRTLLYAVSVVRKRGRLIVSFRLRGPARVSIAAKRGSKVVARAARRSLRRGRHRVALRFRGAAPTQLRIVVKPVRTKAAGRSRR